jgi:hypothetical protein
MEENTMGAQKWAKQANGSGIYEVAHLMSAMEVLQRIHLEISFTVTGEGRGLELWGKVTAWNLDQDGAAQSILGCENVKCSAINLQTVEAAAIHLLYMMDGALARSEMDAKKLE